MTASWYLGPAPPRRRPSWYLPDLAPRTARKPATVGVKVRSEPSGRPTMFGYFSVFDQWTEINSSVEGRFMERIRPGALTRTLRDDRDEIRVLFQHGTDPVVSLKPLGTIRDLRDEPAGAAYEVDLFDVPYVTEQVMPGLRSNQFGASFRFTVAKDEIRKRADRSGHNPNGLPEVSVTEVARVFEFGPVSFPAYRGATAAVRSSSGAGADIRAAVIHDAAYKLGAGERWACRPKPGEPGVIERMRVFEDELADWEQRPYWWLGDPRQGIDDVTLEARTTRPCWFLS